MATLAYFSILLLAGVRTEDVATPASLLGPRNFNHHPFEAEQYLKEVEPTKQSPIQFPNDAPPPPRPPLIVTSRPLIESIARSELNPNPIENNSIASPSSVNRVSFKPDYIKPQFRLKPGFLNRIKPEFRLKPQFLARGKDYKAFTYPVVTTPESLDYGPYASVVKPSFGGGDGYHDYEVKQPDYSQRYHNDDIPNDIGSNEYDQGSNYAFSYRVNDQKTGDDFSHSQHSSGSATNGEYRVRLPDGRMQIVSYTADENGYNANVRYDDEEKTVGNSIDNRYNGNGNEYINNGRHNDQRRDYVQNTVKHDNGYNGNIVNSHNEPDYNDDSHDYVQNREYKPIEVTYKPINEDFNQYADLSKEYYNTDYSLEYDGKNDNYEPHRSKFSAFTPKPTNIGTIVVPTQFKAKNFASASTVRPSYEELRKIFLNKNLYNTQPTNYIKTPIQFNVPSTTPSPDHFDVTTERVVVIGTKPSLYTNIRNVPLTATPSPLLYSTPSTFVTPQSYLVSTIANLKNRINAKPVLSRSFIDRINKYLTFN